MSDTPPPVAPPRTRLRWWLLAYVLVLAASHVVRLATPNVDPPTPVDRRVVELAEVSADGTRGARRVRLVYGESGPADAPVVLGVHGSPSGGEDLAQVAGLLADRFRVIWVHLPGFGASTRDVSDYSVLAHAHYLEEFTRELGLERVHLVGFSMGGGVVLELAPLLGERCASVTLLSAIGVQELEWLGDYSLNHGVHGLQLAALLALREGVPHFGALDDGFFSVEYARNFYDSDQRPLRERITGLDVPLLVIHGRDDPLVPFDAALEHHRIAPHSELFAFDGDHFATFLAPEVVAAPLGDFLTRVESGTAARRADATAERLAAAARPFDPSGASIEGFALVAIVGMLALATLVSEDLTCVLAGALVAQGRLDFWPAAAACFVGIYIGDLLLFFAGRFLGARALARAPLRWVVSQTRAERAAEWLERRGLAVIFLSRFTPGMRLPTYFASGALGARASTFALYFAIAAGVWTPLLVWLASFLGNELLASLEFLHHNLLLALGVTVAIVFVGVKLVLPLLSWHGRRRLVGSWRRLTKWEFWPAWAFYPPIVLWICWLALRHRGATVWCAANPGIENGGVVGESKSAILAALTSSDAGRAAVPAFVALPFALGADERVRRFDTFREEHALEFPVVVKPDAGQRGSGVLVAHDAASAHTYLREAPLDLVAQAYAPGQEFGVFYARRPNEPQGRIISITEKHLATVTGDGVHTLEELVLAHPRAVCMADYYLHKNHLHVNDVVPAGEVRTLGELGTHARGAIFLDACELATPELTAAVDALSRGFAGFHFGRYDLRAPSREALARGEGLRVIELNGVTSESTHVYDPRHSVLHGWRTFFAQWSLAFEIGAANRARGAAVPKLLDLLRAWRDYRRGQERHQGG
jgi:membrane protein DedA with SNARE-associated domain/pimeloyl-ACP methyl ester carboxylesterase